MQRIEFFDLANFLNDPEKDGQWVSGKVLAFEFPKAVKFIKDEYSSAFYVILDGQISKRKTDLLKSE